MIKVAKKAKSAVLNKHCDQINNVKRQDATKKIPYGYVSRQGKAMMHVYPWVTRDLIMNYYQNKVKGQL